MEEHQLKELAYTIFFGACGKRSNAEHVQVMRAQLEVNRRQIMMSCITADVHALCAAFKPRQAQLTCTAVGSQCKGTSYRDVLIVRTMQQGLIALAHLIQTRNDNWIGRQRSLCEDTLLYECLGLEAALCLAGVSVSLHLLARTVQMSEGRALEVQRILATDLRRDQATGSSLSPRSSLGTLETQVSRMLLICSLMPDAAG